MLFRSGRTPLVLLRCFDCDIWLARGGGDRLADDFVGVRLVLKQELEASFIKHFDQLDGVQVCGDSRLDAFPSVPMNRTPKAIFNGDLGAV